MEDGVRFQCRVRGWPPGRVHLVVLVLVVLAPYLLCGWTVADHWHRGWDDDPRWTLSWTAVTIWTTSPDGSVSAGWAPGPLWGPESPLVPGFVVPWLLLGAIGVTTVELLRLAVYRSRRVVVTPDQLRLLQGLGICWVWSRTLRPELPVRVVDAPSGVKVFVGSTALHLGRLDPLDLADLVRALGAPAAEPPAPRRLWMAGCGAALVLVLGAGALFAGLSLHFLPPGQGLLRASRARGDQLWVWVDTPARGDLRLRVPTWDTYADSTGTEEGPAGPATIALDRGLVVIDLKADGDTTPRRAYSQGTHNGLFRRGETWQYALEEPGEPAPRPRRTPPRTVRVTGFVRLVEGAPVRFDLTLLPDQTVTLDLAELRDQAGR